MNLDVKNVWEWDLFLVEQNPLIIAGPCSAENEKQLLETARALKNNGIHVLRAGIWKRFQNIDLDECVKEIVNYIKSMQ